jgi:hypothetical protein
MQVILRMFVVLLSVVTLQGCAVYGGVVGRMIYPEVYDKSDGGGWDAYYSRTSGVNKEDYRSLVNARDLESVKAYINKYPNDKYNGAVVAKIKLFVDIESDSLFISSYILDGRLPGKFGTDDAYIGNRSQALTFFQQKLRDRAQETKNRWYYVRSYRLQPTIEDVTSYFDMVRDSEFAARYRSDDFYRSAKVWDASDDKVLADYAHNRYMAMGDFGGYINAYKLSKNKGELQKAAGLAFTYQQKEAIEKELFELADRDQMFKLSFLQDSGSSIQERTDKFLIASVKGGAKNIIKNVAIEQRLDTPLQLKYGKYKVRVHMRLMLDYTPPIKGKGEDYVEQDVYFSLGPENAYTERRPVVFDRVFVYGKYHTILSTLTAVSAKMVGMNKSSDEFDIPFKLNKTSVEYVFK